MTVTSVGRFARLLGVIFILPCLLRSLVANAQPTADGSNTSAGPELDAQAARLRKDARERFVRGLSLAKQGACSSALVEFNASLQLFRTRAALTNVAICLRELGRFVEARDAYATLMTESASTMTSEERAAIDAEIEQLSGRIGEIRVESDPPGAVVVVDAQQRGVTPLVSPVWVDAGTHSVRVFRAGFSSIEASVVVTGRQVSVVRAALEPIRQSGSLVVRETSGAVLNVVVNGAVMGQTPWQGALPPGEYSIRLEGAGDLGSAPNVAKVVADQTSTLVLTSSHLDSEVRVEPTPADSQVSIDGVAVGNGVWLGRLPRGTHRARVRADGYVSSEQTFVARAGERVIVRVALARQAPDAWQSASAIERAYAEVVGGLPWAPSLGGSADDSCGQVSVGANGESGPNCSSESHPVGLLFGVRGGYSVAPRVGVEVFFGYLQLSEAITRRIRAASEPQPNQLFSDDYRDTTKLRGPLAAVSASYRFLERTPITVRVWLGVGRVRIESGNGGRFVGDAMGASIDQRLSLSEREQTIWLPFAGPELRAGYHFGSNFDVDLGVAALLLLPGKTPREGTWGTLPIRQLPIPDQGSGNLGVYRLPDEQALGTSLLLVPNLALRYRF